MYHRRVKGRTLVKKGEKQCKIIQEYGWDRVNHAGCIWQLNSMMVSHTVCSWCRLVGEQMHVEHFEEIRDKGLILRFCDEGGSDASMITMASPSAPTLVERWGTV